MAIRIAFLWALAALSGLSNFSQTPAADVKSPVVGVWRANTDGLPYITLNITDENGDLSGAVLFYLHRREPGKPITSAPGLPEPLFHPVFDGETLTFQVSHRRAHPPGSLSDAPVTFRFKLDGPNRIHAENESDGTPQVELTRSDY